MRPRYKRRDDGRACAQEWEDRANILTRWIDRADDLIPEENPQVQLALKRLSPKEAYDRVFRMRRAFQVYAHHLRKIRTLDADTIIVLSRASTFAKARMDNPGDCTYHSSQKGCYQGLADRERKLETDNVHRTHPISHH